MCPTKPSNPYRLGVVLAILAVIVVAVLPASASAAADRDCSDFADQAAAQRFFLEHGGPQSDPHQLDDVGPGNGVACESLPCPCSRAREQGKTKPPAKRIRAIVVGHVDGDTLKVRERTPANRRHTVRLIGIDSPETRRPGVPVECGGPDASRSIIDLAPKGAKVVLVTDPSQQTRDRYGRLLAYVERQGRDVGHAQIKRGWATTYVYADKPFKRVDAYRRSEDAASRTDRGVHELCSGDFHL
jgi:endonuclease YncB( thermonuclease family)